MRAALLAAGLLTLSCGALAQAPAEPDGYRTEEYRAPVPQTLRGARVVSTAEAKAIWQRRDGIFVDVMPRPPRPNLPPGTIWRDKPRATIPGAVWLPDTGYGALAPPMETWLRESLARITGGDRTKLIVVFCLRDCWMSWNAAKRAIALGYTNVAWFPDGTDGWSEDDLPLEDAHVAPGRPN